MGKHKIVHAYRGQDHHGLRKGGGGSQGHHQLGKSALTCSKGGPHVGAQRVQTQEGVYIHQIECSLLAPRNSFVMTHLEMFYPNNHILWVRIGFPSGHIKVYPILQGENGQNKPENQQN